MRADLHPLLEVPTKVVTDPEAPGWWLSVYPDAREAGGQFVSTIRARGGTSGGTPDPERSAAEAARRARGQVRRYCAANRLNRLGTLTYRGEGCHDPKQIRTDLGVFFRRLRRSLGGDPLPYLWVPEWHPGGHGLHAHFAVGEFIARGKIEAAWGHGFIHIKLLGDLPVGSGTVAEARKAAAYLAKYVSKAPAAGSGLHRYRPADGFQPAKVRVWGRTADEAIAEGSRLIGSPPEYIWRSSETEGWAAPPAVWASWAG